MHFDMGERSGETYLYPENGGVSSGANRGGSLGETMFLPTDGGPAGEAATVSDIARTEVGETGVANEYTVDAFYDGSGSMQLHIRPGDQDTTNILFTAALEGMGLFGERREEDFMSGHLPGGELVPRIHDGVNLPVSPTEGMDRERRHAWFTKMSRDMRSQFVALSGGIHNESQPPSSDVGTSNWERQGGLVTLTVDTTATVLAGLLSIIKKGEVIAERYADPDTGEVATPAVAWQRKELSESVAARKAWAEIAASLAPSEVQ